MYVLRKRLSNAAIAHRLRDGYVGPCTNIHGHEYFFEIEIGGFDLNYQGMIIDFTEIKRICDSWIKENWDHGVLVKEDDYSFINFLQSEDMKYFTVPFNTTAENMSKYLADQFMDELLFAGFDLEYVQVSVWETDTSTAVYRVNRVR